MSILKGVLQEELQRLRTNIAAYEQKLSTLPKGYLYVQAKNGRAYCYRKWRQGSKILSCYVGEDGSDEAKQAKADYSERKRLEAALRQLRKEEARLTKALRHYGD
ncbi:MAG: hypothetical protein E7182_05165 [Erysipelotrichaceae bacterium]|nr:hypothetical protein [Erysipelotrichaceae bacterium]